jgi:hypothetical protein
MLKSLFFLVAIIIVISARPAIGEILFYDDCEQTFDTSEWKPQGAWYSNPDRRYGWLEYSKEQARSGNGSYKVLLKSSDENNCTNSNCRHVQLSLLAPGIQKMQYDTVYWIGFSIYLPVDFRPPSVPGYWLMFWDSHMVPDPGDLGMNLFDTVSTYNKYFQFRINGESRRIHPAYDDQVRKVTYVISPPAKGRWVDYVLHFKFGWNPNNNPFIKVYRDGVLVLDDRGINCSNDAIPPFMKFGLYGKVQYDTIVYYDEFRFGDANSSYAEVAPRGGNSLLPSPDLKIITTK